MSSSTLLCATIALLVSAGGCAISFKDLPETEGASSSSAAVTTSSGTGGCGPGAGGCGGSMCAHGLSPCDDACVDEASDASHCGGCDVVCGAAQPLCKSGKCAPCPSGFDAVGGRCAMSYVLTTANVTNASYMSGYCVTDDPYLVVEDTYVKYDSGTHMTDGVKTMSLNWIDVGPDSGFDAVTAVSLSWLPGGGRYLVTNDGCTQTSQAKPLTASASLDGLPGLQFSLYATEDCPAATTLSWGAAQSVHAAYVAGGTNTIEFVDPGATTNCTPPPICQGTYSVCEVADSDALRINPDWGPGAVARVTVTY